MNPFSEEKLTPKLTQLSTGFWKKFQARVPARKRIEKSRFRRQSLCRFSEIVPQILRRVGYLPKQGVASLDDSEEVFEIMTGLNVHSAASPKSLHLCSQEERRRDDTD
jgi:hypothetical protein